MKKILALLMAVALLATLTACGENTKPNTDTNTTTTTTSADTTTTTDAEESTTSANATTTEANDESTTTATDGTGTTAKPTEGKAPTTTAKPTKTDKTTAAHTHKYTAKVTKAATCTAEGVKTFTCSCGDAYTEKVAAIGHKWGEWKQTTAPSYTAKGQETRTCDTCSKKETRDVAQLLLDELFEEYTNGIIGLPAFDSANKLTAIDVFMWVLDYHQTYTVEPIEESYDEKMDIVYRVYAIGDIDAYTTALLNHTWDYSVFDGITSSWVYNAKNKTITVAVVGGAGGGWSTIYKGYKQIDSTHYVITYDRDDCGVPGPEGNTFEVELIDGKYVIVANHRNW